MEIRIDTKKDSHNDIKKMIAFLQKFVEESGYNNYDNSRNESNDDFNIPATSMFDAPTSEPRKKEPSSNEYTIIEY